MKKSLFLFALISLFSFSHVSLAMGNVDFSDISQDNQYFDAIEALTNDGVILGYNDGTFRPNQLVTRAEFLKMALMYIQNEEISLEYNCFEDTYDHWAENIICTAKTWGVVNGDGGDGLFHPERDVDFIEAAKIVSILDGYSQSTNDEPWYIRGVNILQKKNAIAPSITAFTQKITRSEVAEILYRMKNNVYSETTVLSEVVNNYVDFVSDTVPVIMFHYVREVNALNDPLGYNLSIKPDVFEQELKWLKDNNIKTVHLSDIVKNEKAPEKAIVMVFDDGYKDFYTTAYPLLKKYGFTASVAVISNYLDNPNHMNELEVLDIVQNGFEVISHTHNHRELSKVSLKDLDFELSESQRILSQKFGIDVNALIYPVGRYNDTVVEYAKKYYDIAFTTESGIANLNSNNLILPRIRMDNRYGLNGLIKALNGMY